MKNGKQKPPPNLIPQTKAAAAPAPGEVDLETLIGQASKVLRQINAGQVMLGNIIDTLSAAIVSRDKVILEMSNAPAAKS